MAIQLVQMSQRLLGWLVTRPAGALPYGAVVRWWEVRRVPYNIVVGVTGLVSSAVMVAVAFTCESRGGAPIGMPDPPAFAIVGVLLYGVLANVCYAGGWITELIVAKVWAVDTSRFGPIAFTLGTTFSVLLTLVPPALIVVAAAIASCGLGRG